MNTHVGSVRGRSARGLSDVYSHYSRLRKAKDKTAGRNLGRDPSRPLKKSKSKCLEIETKGTTCGSDAELCRLGPDYRGGAIQPGHCLECAACHAASQSFFVRTVAKAIWWALSCRTVISLPTKVPVPL